MTRIPFVAAALLASALAGCATTDTSTEARAATTSNLPAGAAATSTAGAKAIGAYGAIGTSDDVRGRSTSSGTSVLSGRANMAGSDSGASSNDDDDDPPRW